MTATARRARTVPPPLVGDGLGADRFDHDRRERSRDLAYAVLRLGFGLNFLVHGLVRLPELGAFAAGVAGSFEGTLVPPALALPFAYVIPPVELVVGAALVVGLYTRGALVAGGLLMAALQVGTVVRQEWGTLDDQVLYALVFFVLLYAHRDALSLDGRRRAGDDARRDARPQT